MGTKHYNYLVRLGLPFPPEEAIDSHIMSMESEIEKECSSMDEGNYLFIFMCHYIIDFKRYCIYKNKLNWSK